MLDRFILVLVACVLFAHQLNAASSGLDQHIIGEDNRITLRQKANDDPAEAARLARDYPTRQFRCGNWVTTANVVYKNNVILVPAHALYDGQCELRAGYCYLTDHDGTTFRLIDIKTLISGVQLRKAANKDCRLQRQKLSREDPSMDAADWAVLKLTAPLEDAHPYDLSALSLSDEGMAATLVAARSGSRDDISFQVCRWKNTKVVGGRIQYLKTDCDAEGGMSGGALVNDRRQIVGILTGGLEVPNGKAYDELRNYNRCTPVSDEVIRAARTVAGLSQD